MPLMHKPTTPTAIVGKYSWAEVKKKLMEIERADDNKPRELFDSNCKSSEPCQTKISKFRAPRFKKTDLEYQLEYIEKCVLQPHRPKSYMWLSTITMPAVTKKPLTTDSDQQYQRVTVELTTTKSYSPLGKLGKKSLLESIQSERGPWKSTMSSTVNQSALEKLIRLSSINKRTVYGNPSRPLYVKYSAVTYQATPRIMELAQPVKRFDLTDTKPDALRLGPATLRYQASSRIVELAQPRKRQLK